MSTNRLERSERLRVNRSGISLERSGRLRKETGQLEAIGGQVLSFEPLASFDVIGGPFSFLSPPLRSRRLVDRSPF